MAVAEDAAARFKLFGYEVARQNDFLPLAAADEGDAQPPLQILRRRLPCVVEFAVVNQAHQHVARQGGKKFALEQAVFQHRLGRQGGQQFGHQGVDGGGGGGKLCQTDNRRATGLFAIFKHGVAGAAALVPDAELGAHPVMPLGRGEHRPFGHGDAREQAAEEVGFVCELAGVAGISHGGFTGGKKGRIIAAFGRNTAEAV